MPEKVALDIAFAFGLAIFDTIALLDQFAERLMGKRERIGVLLSAITAMAWGIFVYLMLRGA